MNPDDRTQFDPTTLKSFEFGSLLQIILDKTDDLHNKFSELEKSRMKIEYDLVAVVKTLESIQKTLAEVVDPRKGLIAMVEEHHRKFKALEDEKIVETVRDNAKVIKNLNSLTWLVVAAIIGLTIKIIFPL